VAVGLDDVNGDGKFDIDGFALETGQWWVALSNGLGATNQLWTTWSTAVNWVWFASGDFNNDGRVDIAGLVQETGQWWVAVSNGSQFTNQLWTNWSPAVTWVDVWPVKF
jgi:hypothetical protein